MAAAPTPGAAWKRNQDARSQRGQKRTDGEWVRSAIVGDIRRGTGILNNPVYKGEVVWGRSRWIRSLATARSADAKSSKTPRSWSPSAQSDCASCPTSFGMLSTSFGAPVRRAVKRSGPREAAPGSRAGAVAEQPSRVLRSVAATTCSTVALKVGLPNSQIAFSDNPKRTLRRSHRRSRLRSSNFAY
jgi:hypothetical protein